jgi:hypothetical protein
MNVSDGHEAALDISVPSGCFGSEAAAGENILKVCFGGFIDDDRSRI